MKLKIDGKIILDFDYHKFDSLSDNWKEAFIIWFISELFNHKKLDVNWKHKSDFIKCINMLNGILRMT